MKVVSVGINSFGRVLLIALGFSIGFLIPIIYFRTIPWLISIPTTFYLFLVAGWIYSRIKATAVEKLRIRRIFPDRIVNGDEVEIILEIINDTYVGIYNVEYIDYYPETVKIVEPGSNKGSLAIPPKSTVKIKYRIKVSGIGKHRFKAFYLKSTDILTLYTIELYTDEIEKSEIRCYPEALTELNQLTLHAKRKYLVGLHRTIELGYSMEFKDIRRYVPGDVIKFIDWKATARRRRLMIREYHREVENDIVVLIRISQSMLAGRLGRRKYDYIVNSISRLLIELIDTSDRLGIAIFGGVYPVVRQLSRVRIYSYREIMDILTEVPFNIEYEGPIDYGEILSRLRLRGKTLFLYITDLEDEEEIDLIRILRLMKHTVYVISPSTTRFAVEELEELDKIAFQVLRHREDTIRKMLIDRLLSMDVVTIDVGPETILEEILERISRFRRLTPS